MAVSIDVANKAQAASLRSIETKVDTMMNLFQTLATPREKDVLKFMNTNGGPKACIEEDQLLTILVKKTGEPIQNIFGNDAGNDELSATRKSLLQELAEDVGKVMDRNLAYFRGKLDNQTDLLEAQNQQLAKLRYSFGEFAEITKSAIWPKLHSHIRDPVRL